MTVVPNERNELVKTKSWVELDVLLGLILRIQDFKDSIEFFLNVFTEFAEFSDKNIWLH